MKMQNQRANSGIAIVLIVMLFCLTAVNAQTDNENDEKAMEIKRLNAEAMGLFIQPSADSLRAAREKFIIVQNYYLEKGNKRYAATTLVFTGRVSYQLGDYADALEHLNKSISLWQEIGDKKWEALTSMPLGFVYISLGEYEKSLKIFQRILELSRITGDKLSEAQALGMLSDDYYNRGEYEKSLEFDRKALSIYEELGAGQNVMGRIGNMGYTLYAMENRDQAVKNFQKAISLARSLGDKASEAGYLSFLGIIYYEENEKEKALDHFHKSIVLYRVEGSRRNESGQLYELQDFWKKDNPRLAIFFGKKAVNFYQVLRSKAQGLDKNLQQSFLKSIENPYRQLADTLITNRRYAEAQQVLNAFKDQQFFDFSSDKQFSQITLTAREAEMIEILDEKIENAAAPIRKLDKFLGEIGKREPTAEETQKIENLKIEEITAYDDFIAFLKTAEKTFNAPLDEKDVLPEISDLQAMQNALRQTCAVTKQKTVAIYTLFGDKTFHRLIVTPDNIKAVSTPIQSSLLNNKAKQYWGILQSDKYDPTVLGKELYDTIFAPIEMELPKDTKTIVWSLDSNLRYVPMAALFDGKKYLVERFNNVVFTRADTERMTRSVSKIWTGTGFGSTKAQTVNLLGDKIPFNALPGVAEELREIFKTENGDAGIIAGEVLPDAEFNKPAMLAALKQNKPLVHIASHFNFRPGDEARSFLLMGDGTAFTLEEMKRENDLFAGVELLTLSACNTAAQQSNASGREVDGFAELAQRLGAGAVMATLWAVADNSTPWLMRDFYANRQNRKGMNKAESLRQAQIALLKGTAKTKPLPFGEKSAISPDKVQIEIVPDDIKDVENKTRSGILFVGKSDAPLYEKNKDKPFAHPYFWSPFVLIGNWQ